MTSGDDKKQLGRIALKQWAVFQKPAPEVDELKALSEKHGVPGVDLRRIRIRLADLELVPVEIARQHVILPVLVTGERLFVAMANPQERKIIDELEFVSDKKVFPYVAPASALSDAIDEAYRMRGRGEEFFTGADCPPETAGRPLAPPTPVPPRAVPAAPEVEVSEISEEELAIVVGDAMDRAARSSEVPVDEWNDLEEASSPAQALPGEGPGARTARGKTVLIVDDEDEIRALLERLIESKGYRVLSARDGTLGLSLVKQESPDLIILDAMLPGIHGFDIARRIKHSERYRHIPIIMVSAVYKGWRFAEDMRESSGVEHYIEKPFKIADVLRAVEETLGRDSVMPSSRKREMSEEAEKELHTGVAAYEEGRLDDAIVHLKRGIAIDPLAFRLHFHLGLLFARKELVFDAIGELEKAVEINPRHFPAVRNLAILYQKAGFRNRATEMWERAMTVAPDDVTRQGIKQHILSLL